MKNISHWTPKYLKNRTAEVIYQRCNPELPWLTPAANEFLASYLRPTDIGLELGSGRSTLWFAKKLKQLTSLEHDEGWYKKVRADLATHSLSNVDYQHVPMDVDESMGGDAAYVNRIDQIKALSMDFVLVDGAYRDHCALKALRTIRGGGLLIIDNANWFLPSNSSAPLSRTYQQGPNGAVWEKVNQIISSWRFFWTSSGVTDTAIFFKPGDKE